MEETTNLKLPLLVPNQSQKEITHNEALVILDNLVNNGVKDKDLTTPPENPSQNDLYIVGVGASGQARQGTKYWVNDENCIYVFNMTSWSKFSGGEGGESSGGGEGGATSLSQLDDVSLSSISKDDILKFNGGSFVNSKSLNNLEGVGINCEFDEDNKLMVKSDYVLFDNNGGDSKIKANKSTTTQTASHLFQDNYSGRAEFGLIGNDDFSLKVSSDGSEWKEAFVVDKSTGNIDFKGDLKINNINLDDYITSKTGSNNTQYLPDYSAGISISNTVNIYNAPSIGYFYIWIYGGIAGGIDNIKINNIEVFYQQGSVAGGEYRSLLTFFVNKNDIITWSNASQVQKFIFYPLKGVENA